MATKAPTNQLQKKGLIITKHKKSPSKMIPESAFAKTAFAQINQDVTDSAGPLRPDTKIGDVVWRIRNKTPRVIVEIDRKTNGDIRAVALVPTMRVSRSTTTLDKPAVMIRDYNDLQEIDLDDVKDGFARIIGLNSVSAADNTDFNFHYPVHRGGRVPAYIMKDVIGYLEENNLLKFAKSSQEQTSSVSSNRQKLDDLFKTNP